MKFVYYWKTSANERHEGEIEAVNREEAFALLRERGIRAIKVEPKGWETGKGYRGVAKRWVTVLILLTAVVAGTISYFGGRNAGTAESSQNRVRTHRTIRSSTIESNIVALPEGECVAEPHPRKYTVALGKICAATNIFTYAAESYLVHFALPGMALKDLPPETPELIASLCDSLDMDIIIYASDSPEIAELKRIVAGLKEEAALYVRSGSGLADYLRFIKLRQKMEEDCRQRIIEDVNFNTGNTLDQIRAANETLSAMGLAPIE